MQTSHASRLAPCTLLVLLLLPGVSACGKKDEVKIIRALIQEGAELAEKHRIADLMKITVPDFAAQPGHNDRDRTAGILLSAFQYYGRFKIHYPRPAVRLDETGLGASAALHFLIVNQDRSLPDLPELNDDPQRWLKAAGEMADLYRLELQWTKIDGDWKVTQAKLEGAEGL